MSFSTDSMTRPIPINEDEIMNALQMKRGELDTEIANFKAQKELELDQFEKGLRDKAAAGMCKSNSFIANDAVSNGGDDWVEKRDRRLRMSNSSLDGVLHADNTKRDTSRQEDAGGGIQFGSVEPANVQREATFEQKEVQRATSSHREDRAPKISEHEMELGELFVSSYLPLLEAPRENAEKATSPIKLSDTSRKQYTAPSSLSPSFTLSSQAYNPLGSPKEPPRLPSSLPRPRFVERRSSSRSDSLSGKQSLRSSLRQPKSLEEPSRISKHVLFSINNMVISPSSSPVAQRTKAEKAQPAVRAESQHMPIGTNVVEQSIVIPTKSTGIAMPTSPSTPRSYRDLVEPTTFTPSDAREEADFEMNAGGDPLFDFDEELPKLDDDTDEESKDILTEDEEPGLSQSPHVGSLPIEIRRPPKRDG